MSSNLKILALEPFYDGHRRHVLNALMRRSRHDWELLTLPPRRVERRLAAAARWFGEVIERRGLATNVDLLFTGEMLNMRDLIRCVPKLGRVPSVVYFHDNQTPACDDPGGGPHDMVNLNTAMAATEVWFNSQWHLDDFLSRAETLVERNPEIRGRHPTSEVRAKSQVIFPPVDFGRVVETLAGEGPVERDPRTLLVDTRGIDVQKLLDTLQALDALGEAYRLITVGPQTGLPDDLLRESIHERDEAAQFRAIKAAGVYLSIRSGATTDDLLVHALAAGCWPVVPETGVYGELVAPSLQSVCLHDNTPDAIAAAVVEGLSTERSVGAAYEQDEILQSLEPGRVCRVVDEMLDEVAAGKGIGMP